MTSYVSKKFNKKVNEEARVNFDRSSSYYYYRTITCH